MAPLAWRPSKRPRPNPPPNKAEQEKPIPKFAYIRAYEANLTYSQFDAERGAADGGVVGGSGSEGQRRGLIKWAGSFEDEDGDGSAGEGREVWADRYDIIHLLPSLPARASSVTSSRTAGRETPSAEPGSPASSASSRADEPSDEEALFDLSGDEAIAAYQREKRRKWVDELREKRMRELGDAEGDEDQEAEDEAEEDIQPSTLTLMHHTALSLYRSPNPVQLEAKIFAHHSSDARFAFLRAASSTPGSKLALAWNKAKYDAKVELGIVKVVPKSTQIVGLGYGSSDSESGSDSEDGDEGWDEGEAEGGDERGKGRGTDRAGLAGEAAGVEESDGMPPNEPPSPPPPPPGATPPPAPSTDISLSPPAKAANLPLSDPAAEASSAPMESQNIEEEQRRQAERKARMEAWKKDKERKRQEASSGAGVGQRSA